MFVPTIYTYKWCINSAIFKGIIATIHCSSLNLQTSCILFFHCSWFDKISTCLAWSCNCQRFLSSLNLKLLPSSDFLFFSHYYSFIGSHWVFILTHIGTMALIIHTCKISYHALRTSRYINLTIRENTSRLCTLPFQQASLSEKQLFEEISEIHLSKSIKYVLITIYQMKMKEGLINSGAAIRVQTSFATNPLRGHSNRKRHLYEHNKPKIDKTSLESY